MRNRHSQLRRIELSVTPTQAVNAYLDDTLRTYESLDAQAAAEAEQRSPPPRNRIARQVTDAIEAGMRGQDRDLSVAAGHRGRADADFLLNLHFLANEEVLKLEYHQQLHLARLAHHLPFVSDGDADRAQSWGYDVLAVATDAEAILGAVEHTRRRYFDGREILFQATLDAVARSRTRLLALRDSAEQVGVLDPQHRNEFQAEIKRLAPQVTREIVDRLSGMAHVVTQSALRSPARS